MQSTPLDQSPHPPTLWFGLISGPLAWIIYFLAGYLLIEAACKTTWLDNPIQGFDAISTIVLILTAAGLLMAVVGGWLNFRHWRNVKRQTTDAEPNRTESVRGYMAFSGWLLNLLFGFTVLITGVPALFLSPC